MEDEMIVIEENAPAKRPDRFLPISILIAAVLIGGSVIFSTLYRSGTVAPAAPVVPDGGTAVAAETPSSSAALALGPRDVILGNANAPVTVIEYGDYQCPFCTQFFEQTEPVIVKNYVNKGSVKFVFRDFPFIDRFSGVPAGANESHDAGVAAECAKDQGKFWPYHDALYTAKAADETAQAAKGNPAENDGLYNRALFLSIAGQLGMNTTVFATCIDSGKYVATVNNDTAAAENAGVNSTPTTFVNGVKVIGPDAAGITQAIDAALKG